MRSPKDLYPNDQRVKTFTLPVSGSVVLVGPEVDVVDSEAFQRLAGIKQLGTSNVVFRGALHTRFEHSVGSLHQAERMIQAVMTNHRTPYLVSEPAHRRARLGALLHDLPHIPFGHTLEDEFHLLDRHDTNEPRIQVLLVDSLLGKGLKAALPAGEWEDLLSALAAKNDIEFQALSDPFVGDIIGNTVCADLLDYVPRDLTACGMPVAMGDRFLDYMTVTGADSPVQHRFRIALNLDKRGMPRPDVESEVVKLLTYRYELAERVYFHHAKNAASVMIGRAVQEAGLAAGVNSPPELDANFYNLTDDELVQALRLPGIAAVLKLQRAVGTTEEGISLASSLADGVAKRRLFKISYLAVLDDIPDRADTISRDAADPDRRRALEDDLAAKAGLGVGEVLIHVPRVKMMTKDAEVRVRTDSGDVITLNDWDARHSRRITALNEAHGRLWRVAIYTHPMASESNRALLRAAAAELIGAESRYVPKPKAGLGYFRAVFDQFAAEREWTLQDWESAENGVAALATGERLEDTLAEMTAMIQLGREA